MWRDRYTPATTADASEHLSQTGRAWPTAVVRALDQAGIVVDDVEVHQPSLDDVFFALTGVSEVNERESDVRDPQQRAPEAESHFVTARSDGKGAAL